MRGLPLLGFWLMPNNQTDGEVEDFARLLVPQADRLWTRAEQAVLDIPATDRLFPEHDLMKAKIHCPGPFVPFVSFVDHVRPLRSLR